MRVLLAVNSRKIYIYIFMKIYQEPKAMKYFVKALAAKKAFFRRLLAVGQVESLRKEGSLSEDCQFAANGIGMVFAERGKFARSSDL